MVILEGLVLYFGEGGGGEVVLVLVMLRNRRDVRE